VEFTMKRILRILLVVGILTGGLMTCSPSSQAGPFRRGWHRGYVYGPAYGPGWGYRSVYRPFGFGGGYRSYGWGYPAYGWGAPGYGVNAPAFGVLGMRYPGYGAGYSGFYGTSMSIGSPLGGFYMSSYPY
jgi:hypothetical protein